MDKGPQGAAAVKEPAVMVMPGLADMLMKREYPRLPVPPVCHARLSGDPDALDYTLTYNGFDILGMRFAAPCKPALRFHSDGDFQSSPFIQQFAVAADRETRLCVTVSFPHEMAVLRPGRASNGRAILGQWGHPLIHGVNGLYSLEWDYFITWHGYDFAWQGGAVTQAEGIWSAAFEVNLSTKPLVILLRPRYYGMHLGYEGHRPWLRRPKQEAVSGWCSWEAYHDQVTQQDVQSAAETLAPLKKYGLDTLQLDDGYQNPRVPPAPGKPIGDSWVNLNEKFPGGHGAIAGAIRAAGFRAGIWTNATLTNREAVQQAPYVIRREDGEPLCGDWIRYVIDCTPKMLEKEITPYYRAFREAGYDYIKSDALRHLLFDGLQEAVRLGLLPDDQARERMRAYMRAAREGIGEDAYYLSCWGVLSQSIGVCDAMRVATDANPNFHAYSMQLRETARWFFAQRILFTIDPDHVCVRGELNWVRMMLSAVALTGGLFMISDKPESYDEARLELIRRTLPGTQVRAAETGPVDYSSPACFAIRPGTELIRGSREIGHFDDEAAPFASLWCTHFEREGRAWCVMQRCALTPLDAMALSVEALNLPSGHTYYAFDFWAQEGEVVAGDTLHLPALSLGDTTVLGLYDITDRKPCLVGSDRHVTMDAVSVQSAAPSGKGLVLDLAGFEGLAARYRVYAPEALGRVRAHGGEADVSRQGDVFTLAVRFREDAVRLELE